MAGLIPQPVSSCSQRLGCKQHQPIDPVGYRIHRSREALSRLLEDHLKNETYGELYACSLLAGRILEREGTTNVAEVY